MTRLYRVRTLFVAMLIFWCDPALGQSPVISSISGNVSDGGTVTIDGSNFGAQGPQVVLFDDFESGSPGQEIRIGPGSAALGQWVSLGGNHPHYTASYHVSGSKAFQADMLNNWLAYSEVQLPAGTQELFVSYWRYIPGGDNLPGEGNPDGLNWKILWIQGDGLLTNGTYLDGSADDDIIFPAQVGSDFIVVGNDSTYAGYENETFSKGQWKRVWGWIKNGLSNDGNLHFWALEASGPRQMLNDNNITLLKQADQGVSPGPVRFDHIRLNGFGRETSNCHPTFDDIYVAAGPNARAHIEIGNNPVYANSTKLTLVTSSTWTNTRIQAVVRQGMFSPGEVGYVFVVNSSGNMTPTGSMITFSGSSDNLPPAAPSGLQVTQ